MRCTKFAPKTKMANAQGVKNGLNIAFLKPKVENGVWSLGPFPA